jgi:RNA polymerase-binding transcription factor DksA
MDPDHEAENSPAPVDFDAIAGDLADVEEALARLDTGTYWTDEVTGEPLPDDLLAASPTARRNANT